jgi:uncharacterized protein YndB with AHSA1/START domain
MSSPFDLVLERVIDVRPELVWKAWTEPKHLMPWFCPRPWKTIACEIDLRPGGKFNTTMQSPEGQDFPNAGCFLEVVPGKRLVFTDCLQPGYRPTTGEPFMTAIVEIIPEGDGTRYKATAMHANEETVKRHVEMGFHQGWATALDQMVEYIKTNLAK